jgi:hypothetical protein
MTATVKLPLGGERQFDEASCVSVSREDMTISVAGGVELELFDEEGNSLKQDTTGA